MGGSHSSSRRVTLCTAKGGAAPMQREGGGEAGGPPPPPPGHSNRVNVVLGQDQGAPLEMFEGPVYDENDYYM